MVVVMVILESGRSDGRWSDGQADSTRASRSKLKTNGTEKHHDAARYCKCQKEREKASTATGRNQIRLKQSNGQRTTDEERTARDRDRRRTRHDAKCGRQKAESGTETRSPQ